MIVNKIQIGYPEWENENQATEQAFLVNQCGYDTDKTKRATIVNVTRNSKFYLVRSEDDTVVFEGLVKNQIADFSAWAEPGGYYLKCNGMKSYPFKIEKNRIFNVSAPLAVRFMESSRQDAFNVGGSTGYGWRDSHQFSFELNTLVMMYMANPSYYKSKPYDVYKITECEYADLQTQNEPNIIWLMKFGAERYWDWCVNDGIQPHALIKGQLAYFLYLYPHIQEFVSADFYQKIRDFAVAQWSVETCNKAWFDVSINHNLFTTQSAIGGLKGACPPGYAIVPNLMMYEVATRDGLDSAENFRTAAQNNIAWLVNSVDLTDPANTKGQRMSEYITFHSLTYAYEMYPELCPDNTYEKILEIAKVFISRSDNLWDYTQYQTKGDLSGATSTIWVNDGAQGTGYCNNPGYCGMMCVYYSLARVIKDETISTKLRQLAVTHLDHAYGRNPLGRHYCYTARDEFDGAKKGWVTRLIGIGSLGECVGALDGSPKNENFPYAPDGDTGYTEAWIAFNSAWNMSLAYLCGENPNITDGIGIFAK